METRKRVTSKLVKSYNAPLSNVTPKDLVVDRLPGRKYPNPSQKHIDRGEYDDKIRHIMYDPRPQDDNDSEYPVSSNPLKCELAHPRKNIHFNPTETTFGVVTCGGICPGLNDVIRSIVLAGTTLYHVKRVIGFRYGYWGLSKEGSKTAIELSRPSVTQIHRFGGTILGSSRGPQSPKEMVDTLIRMGVNVLFTVGGDGTQRGALTISEEAKRRGVDIAVFGIPKTIDNDLSFSHRTFGFETAVEQATAAVRAAYAEAVSLNYGVGIVKLMGRESGFIAAQTAVASAQANLCLIPERPLPKETVLQLIERRFASSRNCVIIVAEGFGQDWVENTGGHDASGNKKLIDIGVLLKKTVEKWLKENKQRYPQGTCKYIDPSYMVRACPPSSNDALFCATLATLAVHEAMAGATGCIISMRYNNYIVVPIKAATSVRRVVDLRGQLWRQVREITVSLGDDQATNVEQDLRRELEAVTLQRERLIERLSAKI
ncbi:Phosphofructokinase, putative [Angomonas deanei]|uniref:ATP-dependent 6-phosphofructokinase n=1 Tax=Angomonas deanei TaxID=59799 RepID=A0A7G2CI54_9TRYP|nr:Phosphofructokinase, putative [Angomonas deanei]